MEYNTDHTIKKKTQLHTQGVVTSVTDTSLDNLQPVRKTNYVIDYTKYGSKGAKPHALTRVTEAPGWIPNLTATDLRVLEKRIGYDANGNQVEISEMFGDAASIQRRNIWDEQDRLLAVDLRPEDKTQHPIAIYTYDAAGERIVRYNTDQFEVSTNSSEVAQMTKDNIMIYPSGLLMGRAIHGIGKDREREDQVIYTKHYYLVAERISSNTGTVSDLGVFPESYIASEFPQLNIAETRTPSNQKVTNAAAILTSVYSKFDLPIPILNPIIEFNDIYFYYDKSKIKKYYFHPDHLGSSTYISNDLGQVSQHAEYLPFGEIVALAEILRTPIKNKCLVRKLLVDEHKNSNNSPFKFNEGGALKKCPVDIFSERASRRAGN